MEIQLTKSQENALKRIVSILNKEDIEYEIVGGLAAKFYGSRRDLNDIDINIADDGYEKILPHIEKYITIPLTYYENELWKWKELALNYEGQEFEIGLQNTTYIKNTQTGIWYTEEFSYIAIDYDGIPVNVQTKDNVVKYKTLCGRPQDIEDISQLL